MLAGCRIFLLAAGDVTRQRVQLLSRSISAHSGVVCDLASCTHLLADKKYDAAAVRRLLSAEPPSACRLLSLDWLVRSLGARRRLDEADFLLSDAAPPSPARKRKREASPEPDSEPDSEPEPTPEPSEPRKPLPRGSWVCATSSVAPKPEQQNQRIISVLSEMADTYSSINDKWRTFGYQKAVQALRKLDRPVASREDVLRLPGVGARLAEKIWEIAESGGLCKLDHLKEDERVQATQLFTAVWGVGPTTAQAWVQAGYRSLEEVRRGGRGLTRQQEAGLRHFHDLQERMPRAEAQQIVERVAEAVAEDGPGFVVQGCGSLRRGKATCGDVDVLVTHPDGHSHRRVFPGLLRRLESENFLIEHLVTVEENGNQKKYLGVCRLTPESKARRIDVIVVPASEHACALLYFTGSAHFTRSMRHLAKRLDMSLNEHALSSGVVRKDAEKIYKGTPLHCPTEESVFKHLGIPFREPHERDH